MLLKQFFCHRSYFFILIWIFNILAFSDEIETQNSINRGLVYSFNDTQIIFKPDCKKDSNVTYAWKDIKSLKIDKDQCSGSYSLIPTFGVVICDNFSPYLFVIKFKERNLTAYAKSVKLENGVIKFILYEQDKILIGDINEIQNIRYQKVCLSSVTILSSYPDTFK